MIGMVNSLIYLPATSRREDCGWLPRVYITTPLTCVGPNLMMNYTPDPLIALAGMGGFNLGKSGRNDCS